jgi:protein-tyrosine phosphatase
MVKTLFVCHGNICRSPLAQGIFDYVIKDKGFQKYFSSDSCGVSDEHIGENADHGSIKVACEHGIKINNIAKQFKPKFHDEFDYIIAMDLFNQTEILRQRARAVSPKSEILMMRKFDPFGENINVPDPYGEDFEAFEETFEILYRSIINYIDFLVIKYNVTNN